MYIKNQIPTPGYSLFSLKSTKTQIGHFWHQNRYKQVSSKGEKNMNTLTNTLNIATDGYVNFDKVSRLTKKFVDLSKGKKVNPEIGREKLPEKANKLKVATSQIIEYWNRPTITVITQK